MTVFISHKSEDSSKARGLRNYLQKASVHCWLDVIDLSQTTNETLAQHIIGNLNQCSHILVVFSEQTHSSMWVPFELGAAYNAQKGIATYLWYENEGMQPPSYLNDFPMLSHGENHIDEFIKLYKENFSGMSQDLLKKSASSKRLDPAEYIRTMKKRINQP